MLVILKLHMTPLRGDDTCKAHHAAIPVFAQTQITQGLAHHSVSTQDGDQTYTTFQMRSLLASSLVCCAFLLMSAHASAQDTKTRRTAAGSAVSVTSYTEIPAATEACTPEECDWWNRLREAGNKVLRKGDEKSMSAYASLFVEGIAKSYKVPLADRPSQVLSHGQPVQITNLPLKQRNGTVRLSVEHRADGSVGEIKVLTGVGTQVDQRYIQAARSVIFLPAVKDRQFVAEWQTAQYRFGFGAGSRN